MRPGRTGSRLKPQPRRPTLDSMQLVDLLPVLHHLPRMDKFRALQFLTTELAQEESAGLLTGTAYPVWSPHDAVEAAATLKDYLREHTSGQ